MTRNALGRGVGAISREPEPQIPQPQTVAAVGAIAPPSREIMSAGPQQIDIDLIDPSPYQPRTRFREEALEELARSIKASGIIQPLVVRPIAGRFQLIAGERRWRAAQRAGLTKVSAIVRQVSDELALEMTLVENIQREDLNAGHGRALLAVADPQLRMRYAQRASRGGLTVRQIERLAARRVRTGSVAVTVSQDVNIRAALDELQRHLGTKVLLREKTKVRPGQLVLEYYEDAQLMGLYDRLMK